MKENLSDVTFHCSLLFGECFYQMSSYANSPTAEGWMICFINLQSSLNRLYQAKKQCQQNDNGRNPESEPPLSMAPIVPPLCQRFWFRLVKNGFECSQAQSPVFETVDLSLFGIEGSAFSRCRVEEVLGLFV